MGGPLKVALLFDNFNTATIIMPILFKNMSYLCGGNSSNITTNLFFMEVFCLMYEGLNPNDTGLLAMYANRFAAQEALEYVNSLTKYFKLWIEVSFVSDKFLKSDFN